MNESSLIDSHCHLIFENFQDDLEEVAYRWREVGVKALVHACVEVSEIKAIRALADRFPELKYAVGVHPLDAKSWTNETIGIMKKAALEDSRVVAIGELGLDLFRETNLDEQLDVLKSQLDLAVELDLPVIVHCRDAASPMLALLNKLKLLNRCPKGVMHCWAGNEEEMKGFLDLGFYISFSGIVTFPKAYSTHLCAREVPSDRYLIETDCPFLAPVPWRGKRNEPAFVESVAKKIAEIREEPFETVANQSSANATKLFNLI